MQYLISKTQYSKVTYMNCDEISGYKITPKKSIPYGITVNELIIVKPNLVEKIIKRKIKSKLDHYLNLIINGLDGQDDDDGRIALDDIQRYRLFVKDKYGPFLDEKYLGLLNKKFDVLQRELKSIFIYANIEKEEKQLEESEIKRSR